MYHTTHTDRQTYRYTNTVVALAQADIGVKLELQDEARLTDANVHI